MKKAIPALAFATALSLAAALASTAAAAAAVEMNLGHTLATSSHYQVMATRLAELAARKSNGEIKINVFPQSQLGGEVKMIQAARTGTLDLFITAQAPLTNTIKTYGIFDVPYLFDSVDQANRVLAGPVGRQFLEMMPRYNLVGLGWLSVMERNVFSSKKPIGKSADLSGFKIRVMQSPGYVKTYEALGAQPTPMAYADVYMALQQGVVDGADTSPDQFIADKFIEVAKFYNRTRVHYLPALLIISKSRWDSLSPNPQKALKEASDEAIVYGIEYYRKSYSEAIEQMKKAGVQVVETELGSMKKATLKVDEQLLGQIPNGRKLYESIQSAKKK